jgi:hypothetical protein
MIPTISISKSLLSCTVTRTHKPKKIPRQPHTFLNQKSYVQDKKLRGIERLSALRLKADKNLQSRISASTYITSGLVLNLDINFIDKWHN